MHATFVNLSGINVSDRFDVFAPDRRDAAPTDSEFRKVYIRCGQGKLAGALPTIIKNVQANTLQKLPLPKIV